MKPAQRRPLQRVRHVAGVHTPLPSAATASEAILWPRWMVRADSVSAVAADSNKIAEDPVERVMWAAR